MSEFCWGISALAFCDVARYGNDRSSQLVGECKALVARERFCEPRDLDGQFHGSLPNHQIPKRMLHGLGHSLKLETRNPKLWIDHQVDPVGFSIFILGFSMIMPVSGAPAGIIGNTLSSLTTSASTMQGPWL